MSRTVLLLFRSELSQALSRKWTWSLTTVLGWSRYVGGMRRLSITLRGSHSRHCQPFLTVLQDLVRARRNQRE